jgi:hypothetical protein
MDGIIMANTYIHGNKQASKQASKPINNKKHKNTHVNVSEDAATLACAAQHAFMSQHKNLHSHARTNT